MILPYLCRFDPRSTSLAMSTEKPVYALNNSSLKKFSLSIVMSTYNSSIPYLVRAIESVRNQTETAWELCITDDASSLPEVSSCLRHYCQIDKRIKVRFRQENGHISRAGNDSIKMATGDFIGFLDHDDELRPDALERVSSVVSQNPGIKFIFSDQDKIDEFGYRYHSFQKPGWNRDLGFSHNYICHFSVYQSKKLRDIGGLRPGFEGSQDHDLMLRFTQDLSSKEIFHIPEVLYHWRSLPSSTAGAGVAAKPYALDNGRRAVESALATNEFSYPLVKINKIFYQTHWRSKLASRQKTHLVVHSVFSEKQIEDDLLSSLWPLDQTISHIHFLTSFAPETCSAIEKKFNRISGKKIFIHALEVKKRISHLINSLCVNYPEALFIIKNQAISAFDKAWTSQLIGQASRRDIGCASGKIIAKNQKIISCGFDLDKEGKAKPIGRNIRYSSHDDFSRYQISFNCDVVGRDLMAFQSSDFLRSGSFPLLENKIDEDISLCIQMQNLNLRHVIDAWMPYQYLTS